MILALLLLSQTTPMVPAQPPAQPCRLQDARGKLIDVPAAACQQSTWDRLGPIPLVPPPNPVRGATAVAFDISADGRVENCRVVEPSGNPALDAKACAITTERARYKPALDADGKPKRTSGRIRVSWPRPG